MRIQHASLASNARPNAARLHVFPDKKDNIFPSDQREEFTTSAKCYLEAYDQVGRSGAKKGAKIGGALFGTAALFGLGAAALLTGDSLTGLLLGTGIGATAVGVAGAIVLPAMIDGTRHAAQDKFASNHSAPYLEVGPRQWLTADSFLMHDRNGQTDGRL